MWQKKLVQLPDSRVSEGVVVIDPASGAPTGMGAVTQAIPDFENASDVATAWGNFAGVNWAGGDFVTSVPGVNGQYIVALSGSPLTAGESYVVNTNKAVQQPCDMEFAGSFVRTGVSFATASLFANDPVTGAPDPVPGPINIVSWYQSSAVAGASNTGVAGTVMTMLLDTALPSAGSNSAVFVGDWVNITGLADTRFNYPNACISYISPDRKTITVSFSDEAALPSLVSPASAGQVNTPTLGTAKVNFYNNMSGARNGIGLRFSGSTATSAAITSIFGGDDNQISGTLLGDHRVTISTTAPNYVSGALWGQAEIRANSRFLLEAGPKASVVMDKSEQTHAQWTPRDIPRTSVKPSSVALMYPRFRLYKPASMTRPVAKIVSAVHASASTTTVVTMDVAPSTAGLAVGNYVTLRGVRDQTNFANSATSVAITAVDDGNKQITVAWGSAAIATSYGGSVIVHNGGKDQPGIIGQIVQSVQSRVADGANWLDVNGNTTWSGVNIGDYVDLHGVRDNATGADLGLDGAWEVAHFSTTLLVLKPVFNISGSRVSPALGTLSLTNCGGSVILRPTLRSHDLDVNSWSVQRTQIDGQGTTRADKAVPTVLVADQTTSTARPVQGAQANQSTSVPQPVLASVFGVSANPATGTTGRQQQVLGTLIGAMVVKPFSIPEADWRYTGTLTTNTAVAAKTAGSAGIKNYVTGIQIQNTNAVATTFLLLDGSTTIWSVSLPASMTTPVDFTFPTPLAGTAATAMNVNCGTTGANVITNVQGYQAP